MDGPDWAKAEKAVGGNRPLPESFEEMYGMSESKKNRQAVKRMVYMNIEQGPLETGPQKTVRLLEAAAGYLKNLLALESEGGEDPSNLRNLIAEIEDHAENGVLADDEYEMAVLWMTQQSGKPPRLVRRVLQSKLNIRKPK